MIGKLIETLYFNLFGIYREDLNRTVRLQSTIFLLITSLLILKPTITALFLDELSADALPLGYLFTAILALAGSYFYNQLSERYELKPIFRSTIIISACSLLLFGFLLRYTRVPGVIYYLMYTWVGIFGLLVASQFWTLANMAFNIREAKRIFGFIGAGAIAGAIFGGYLTSILANYFSPDYFLWLAALILLITLPIIKAIWQQDIKELNPFQRHRRKGPSGSSLQLIKKSPLLTQIAWVLGIGVIVAKLVDYQYSDFAARTFPDQGDLTSFLGFWLSTLSVCSLIIQLFFTKRVVGTYGIGRSLLWLPVGLIFGSILFLIVPALWVVVFIKIVEGGLKQSINKSSTELLSMPVPLEIKKKTKPYIDVVIDSIATGIAGVLLILLINALNVPLTGISAIIMVLSGIWIYFAGRVRVAYMESFKKMISPKSSKQSASVNTLAPIHTIVQSVNRVLLEGKDKQTIYMLRRLMESPDSRFYPQLITLLQHPSTQIRSLAIENLYFLTPQPTAVEMVWEATNSQNFEILTSAFRFLIKHQTQQIIEKAEYYSQHDDQMVRNAWLVGSAMETRNNKVLAQQIGLIELISQFRNSLQRVTSREVVEDEITLSLIKAIGMGKIKTHYDFLWKHLENLDPEIVKYTLLSCAQTLEPQFIPAIVRQLPEKYLRKAALDALSQYGEPIIETLMTYFKSGSLSLEQAIHLPQVFESFDHPKAVNSLLTLAHNSEHAIKIEALAALKTIKEKRPHLKIQDRYLVERILDECALYQDTLATLHLQMKSIRQEPQNLELQRSRQQLIELLKSRLEQSLMRIFSLLGLKYPPDDIEPIYHKLLKGKADEQIHAIEFLDNLLTPKLKRELIPIVETSILEAVTEDNLKSRINSDDELDYFRSILKLQDQKLQLAIIKLAQVYHDGRYLPLLSENSNHANSKVKNAVRQALSYQDRTNFE